MDNSAVLKMYNYGLSMPQIADILKCSTTTIFLHMKKVGYTPKKYNRKCKGKPGVQKEFHNYFEVVDCPEKAWFLGWLLSDGHMTEKTNSIQFTLDMQDFDVLYRFSKIFKGTMAHLYPDKGICRYSLYSDQMQEDIQRIGIPKGRKSYQCKPLKLKKELMPHFWRGVWEGDGHIIVTQKSSEIGLTGTYDICEQFQADVLKHNNKIYKNNDSFCAKRSSNKRTVWQNLYDYFYDDYTLENRLFLQRKHILFHEALSICH
jgi:hypothetical protein